MKVDRTRLDDIREFRQFLENWDHSSFFYGQSVNKAPLARWAKEILGDTTLAGITAFVLVDPEFDEFELKMTDWQQEYARHEATLGIFNKWVAIEALDHVVNEEEVA
jgi:hypothetical protein